jgi:DNA-binding transcriptional MerR regulator/uncharacterized glyoxalase superfamily protein PhnB
MAERTWRIGALAAETGLTVRTLHYYDSVGLVSPSARTSGGHRIYAQHDVERLYAVLVLRRLGMGTAAIGDELGGPAWNLRSIAGRQRAELDAQMVALGSLRHRIDGLVDGAPADEPTSPAALIREMQQLAGAPFAVRHALALLPYPDLEHAQRRLVEMFGFEAGAIERDTDGVAVHASVLAGTGIVHLHPVMDDVAPPGPTGIASAIVVAAVADADAHAAHAHEHGARITYGPADMTYGVREYGARDHAGHPWTFQSPLRTQRTGSVPAGNRKRESP